MFSSDSILVQSQSAEAPAQSPLAKITFRVHKSKCKEKHTANQYLSMQQQTCLKNVIYKLVNQISMDSWLW